MRKLTAKQKKILKEHDNCRDIEDLPYEVWEKLENINDTEILWQEANRFLADQFFNKKYN